MTNFIDDVLAPRVTVKLSKAIGVLGEKEITELTFREPTVGDLIVADQVKGGLAKTAAVLASMCDVSLPVFKSIGTKDFQKIVAATEGLLGNDLSNTTGD